MQNRLPLAVLLLIIFSLHLVAGDGDLDSTFSTDGIVFGGSAGGSGVAIQPAGSPSNNTGKPG